MSQKTTTHIDARRVAEGFLKGGVLLNAGDYQVHTARRIEPGQPEVHEFDTDIFYMIEGVATIVTGGTLENPRTVAPNEIRGTGITGGISQRLAKGDVIVIPEGDPHWFREVPVPVTYLAIKVRKGS